MVKVVCFSGILCNSFAKSILVDTTAPIPKAILARLNGTVQAKYGFNLTCKDLDIDAEFLIPLTSISDKDSNGIAETTVASADPSLEKIRHLKRT